MMSTDSTTNCSEYSTQIAWYIHLHLTLPTAVTKKVNYPNDIAHFALQNHKSSKNALDEDVSIGQFNGCTSNSIGLDSGSTTTKNNGRLLSADGPAPYQGNILDDPDLLWTDDQWDQTKFAQAQQRLIQQGPVVASFWRKKYEDKAGMYWHNFYKRNADHFYKDRHYLHIVYPELSPKLITNLQTAQYLLEVGSGVGNAIFPLIEINPTLHVHAIDFAASAIEILKTHPLVASTGRVQATVCNIICDSLPVTIGSMDFVLCMFVLSAIGPGNHQTAIHKLAQALKPGGTER